VDNRATREFSIADGLYEPLPLPPDAQIYDMRMLPQYLPKYRDVYHCRGFTYPSDRRYHIIRAVPLLYDISPASYHHLLVFECPRGFPGEYGDPDYQAECPVIPPCSTYRLGWALGAETLYFDKFGGPIGDGPGAAVHVLQQSHIDNPYSQTDLYERGWGFRFWYTATLRDIEGGSFGFYSGTPLVGIPPGEPDFPVMSECTGETTAKAFTSDIYIDSVFTHMHDVGKSSKLEVLRENEEGEWIQLPHAWDMNHYDANWQGSRHMRDPGYLVKPGDKLRQHCSWNTTLRDQPTRNGEGYDDEMCISYVVYYPFDANHRPLSICAEFPPGIGITFSDFGFDIIRSYEYEPWTPPPDTCSV